MGWHFTEETWGAQTLKNLNEKRVRREKKGPIRHLAVRREGKSERSKTAGSRGMEVQLFSRARTSGTAVTPTSHLLDL